MGWWDKRSMYANSGQVSRRSLITRACTAYAAVLLARNSWAQGATGVHFSVAEFDRVRILAAAEKALNIDVLSLVSHPAPGHGHDPHYFYSSYVPAQNNGTDAPERPAFLEHVDLLVQMCANVAALTAAWRLQGRAAYCAAAIAQLRAWMIDPITRMEPSLSLSGVQPENEEDQRYNGFAQTVALAEAARAAAFLLTSPSISEADANAIRQWFADLLTWMNDSKKGSIAREAKDLQSICWTMQAAEIARLTRNDLLLRDCTHRFRDKLLRFMNLDGVFPTALVTDRPYASVMFTLECMASICESVSTPYESLWKFNLPDGRGMHSAVAWAAPFLQSRGKWPYVSDATYFAQQPRRQNALLFAGRASDRPEYIDLWKTLPPDTDIPALRREHPITQPALWTVRPPA